MTLVTSWYGAISGVGQEIAYNGVSAWLYFGLSYYIAAYIYSEFISHKIIDFNISSILIGIFEHMGKKIGNNSRTNSPAVHIPCSVLNNAG